MAIMSRFPGELRRRGVFGTAALYIVAAWVVVQVASEVFPAFDIPEQAIRYVWIGVVLGLPLALMVGWMYEVSTRGISRTPKTPGAGTRLTRFDHLLLSALGILALGIVGVLGNEIVQSRVPGTDGAAARPMDPHSVAVLPLDNFTGDPEQEYFVAGLHEALTAGLTAIRALKVISRTSASAVAGTAKTLPEIGRALGAANLIEGSVFRTGDRVRITVQLIDARTDEHLWAQNNEREMGDLLALQDEVTRAIAEQIEVTLTPAEDARLSERRPVDPETYQDYLRGMYFLKQYTPEGIRKGLGFLQQAVERDPANPRAYAGLALGYNTIGHGIGRDAFPKALAAARQALALDGDSGEAWAALAEAQLYHDYDWEESASSFRRALQLAPSLDHAHAHYAYLLALLRRWDQAFDHMEMAIELSPLDPTWPFFTGWLYMLRDDGMDDAESRIQDSMDLAPDNPLGLYALGQLRTLQGRFEEAVAAHERIPEGNPVRNWSLGPTYAMAGRVDDALRVAAEMAADPGPKDKLHLAFTYAGLGDFDTAMRWFEECYAERVDWLPWVALEGAYGGVLEGIRADPRFRSLVDRLGLAGPAGD
jgi:TolB-like protein/Tfp pilus assembly protein PilF